MTLDQAARIVAEWLGWEPTERNGVYLNGDGFPATGDELLTGDGMLDIKKAAAERGWEVRSYTRTNGQAAAVVTDADGLPVGMGEVWWADAEPEAVLLAVARAIEATKEGAADE